MIEVANLDRMVPAEIFGLLSEDAIQSIVEELADAARAEWVRIAGAELRTTRRDYLAGIQPVVREGSVATISLVGMLPNLIEQGMDEVDLHDTLLGPNVPVAPLGERGKHQRWRRGPDETEEPDGYYRAIPFRHSTPGTTGAVGQPMGRPFEGVVKDAGALAKQVYKAAKALEGSTSQPGGPTKWGGRLAEGLAPKLKAFHATDIYAGMVRMEKTYVKATQSQYVTFRTISVDGTGAGVGSSPWIRPATPGRSFAKRVSEYVGQIAPQAFDAYVKEATG